MKDDLLSFALDKYTRVPLYYRVAENKGLDIDKIDNWNQIPIINRENLMIDEEQRISPEYYPYYDNRKCLKVRTSGSTGKILNMYWDPREYSESLLQLWFLRKKRYNIKPQDKYCTFYVVPKYSEVLKSNIYMTHHNNELSFYKLGLNEEKISEIYREMQSFQPVWMIVQPSVIALLINFINKNNLSKINSLKYIEFTGEVLSEEIKNKAIQTFKCKVANQYGAYEVNSIAYECNEGKMHCMQSNVYVEIIDDNNQLVEDGREGYICITSLRNNMAPIVRYNIGDKGRLIKSKNCKCGCESKILELNKGRNNDCIRCKNNKTIPAYCFDRAVEAVNYFFKNLIIQYQVIQEEYNSFLVKLSIDNNFQGKSDKNLIEKIFIDNLDEVYVQRSELRFVYYECIFPDYKTGKLKTFYSEVGEI